MIKVIEWLTGNFVAITEIHQTKVYLGRGKSKIDALLDAEENITDLKFEINNEILKHGKKNEN